MERSQNCLIKLERLNKTLNHEEADRVPVSDFFWGSFTKRWRNDLNLPDDANPYYYYDLDWIVTMPNMDPKIQSFETVKEDETEVVVTTGFRKHDRMFGMPHTLSGPRECASLDGDVSRSNGRGNKPYWSVLPGLYESPD